MQDLLLVNVVGLSANSTSALRKQLREKNIKLMVVKNSLARRATEGRAGAGLRGLGRTLAMVWGAADIVALAKEVVRLAGDKEFEKFEARGGVMDGTALTPEEVTQVSKWPTREEQLSILLGQILAPGAESGFASCTSAGGALASQIEQNERRRRGGSGSRAGRGDCRSPAAEAPAAEAQASPEAGGEEKA